MKNMFLMTLVLFTTTMAVAEKKVERKMLEKNAKSVSTIAFPTNILAEQADAIVEVTRQNGGFTAQFTTNNPLPVGAQILFRIIMPDGTLLNLRKFEITPEYGGYNIFANLWEGAFPTAWFVGWTTVEVIVISPGGAISRVSAKLPYGVFPDTADFPLVRADVSEDGNSINLSGFFNGPTVASLNGGIVPVVMGFSPVTGLAMGSVDVKGWPSGEKILTVCSTGECNTRVVYITRPYR